MLLLLGGPRRMKSIRSELSSLWSAVASRAWNRCRLFIADCRLLGSAAAGLDEGTTPGPLELRSALGSGGRSAAALIMAASAAGPVARMNWAKSASDSRGTLASLAMGGGPRGFGEASSTGCELRPVVREMEMDLLSSTVDERARSPAWRASSLCRLFACKPPC